MTATFTATITAVPDSLISQKITMQAAIAAADAASVGPWYVSLVLLDASNNVAFDGLYGTMQQLTQSPQTFSYPYVLPATMPPGQYTVYASVRDSGWHWLTVTQTPVTFHVAALPVVNGFTPYVNPTPPPASAGVVPLVKQADGSHLPAGAWTLVPGMSIVDNSVLDTTKWLRKYWSSYGSYNDHLNDELERYVDTAVTYDTALRLTATPRAGTTGHAPSPSGIQYPLFDSGMVRSVQTCQYFFTEIDLVLPKVLGIWPAFWMDPSDGRVDPAPEMDMMEFVYNGANQTSNMINTNGRGGPIIWHDDNYNTQWGFLGIDPSFYGSDYFVNRSVKIAMLWAEDDTITMYHDGVPTVKWNYPWVFQGAPALPATLMINLAIGGGWPTGNWTLPVPTGPVVLTVNSLRTYIKQITTTTHQSGVVNMTVTPAGDVTITTTTSVSKFGPPSPA